MTDEIQALKDELAELRREVQQLRARVVYHNPMTPTPAPQYTPWAPAQMPVYASDGPWSVFEWSAPLAAK